MPTLHGSWIVSQQNCFFLWGEVWRATTVVGVITNSAVSLHPFCLDPLELTALLQSFELPLQELRTSNNSSSNVPLHQDWRSRLATQVVYLPSDGGLPILSENFAAEDIVVESLELQPWQVEGLVLTPAETVTLLKMLPLGSLQFGDRLTVGEDLRYWQHIYRWGLDLLARSKFLPGFYRKNGTYGGTWQVLLDSNSDRERLAKFIQQMPGVNRAYHGENQELEFSETQSLILGFLKQILDAQVRQWIETGNQINASDVVQTWLQSLSVPSEFEADSKQVRRLETALNNWYLPIEASLIGTDSQLGQNLFRTCFVLRPPTESELKQGDGDWTLEYYLQALDNPGFLLPATAIWQQPGEALTWCGRTVERPQETLLKGLGLASRLYANIAASLFEKLPTSCRLDPIQVYEFIRAIAWQLQENGLGVILPTGLGGSAGEKHLGLQIAAKVRDNKRLGLQSLLDYDLKLAVGEHSISQVEFEQLLAQRSPLVKLNGEWIALQPAEVRAAQEILAGSTRLQLSVEDALRLSTGGPTAIAKLPIVQFETAGILQELINNLTNNQAVEVLPTPATFRGELRPYQARGVSWLAFLEKWSLGACLADDMGLGKTPQLLAFLLHLQESDRLNQPTLVVCPTSVISNWEREVKKFAPSLALLVHHGDKRHKGKTFVKAVANKQVVIVSYAIVYRDEKVLQQVTWAGIVLDEAQNIKNPDTKQAQAVRNLNAGFRIALTGTPVENRLGELWSILQFLNPGYLGERQFFQRRFAIPIEKYGDRASLQTLRSLVRPFILRRLKTDRSIIQDLPEKQEMNVYCSLSVEQGQRYQQLVETSLAQIETTEGIQRRGLILTLLLKLKQICNHPELLNSKIPKLDTSQTLEQFGRRSGKLLRLEEMLEEATQEGDRALIFTQFAEWGKLLKPYLQKKLGKEVLFLYGSVRREQRQEMIDRFQNDPNGPQIFILSLKAGGTGLNLTRANRVFHIDRWWNPAVENQATDRAFRIGQKQNVQVHRFVCTGTLEERISDMLESKKHLAEQTVDVGEQWLTELDTDRLRNLLLLDRDAVIAEE